MLPDELTITLPADPESETPRLQLVTLWLPESLCADINAIRAASGETTSDVLLRHCVAGVQDEANDCRSEG